MAFFSPEISAPYRDLMYNYAGEDERVTQDALGRARQLGAQQAARGGFKSPRGVALNTYNRLSSDVLTDRAQREKENRLNYTKTMAQLPSTPSAFSQIFSPLASGAGAALGPAIGKGIAGGLGSLWNMGAGALTNAYSALAGGWGDTAGSVAGGLDWSQPTENLFNLDFGNVWGL